MTLRFYMDHNVSGAITAALRAREIDCLTAREDGAAEIADDAVFQRAVDLDRVLFTEDVDFFAIAARWSRDGREFPGLVFARQMGVTIGQAIFDLQLLSELNEPDAFRNQIVWLPI
jgi:hypothetical protein